MKLERAIAVALTMVVTQVLVACGPTGAGGGDSGATDASAPCLDGGASTGDGGVARTWTCSFSEAKFGPDTTHATNCSDTNLHVDVAYTASETASGDVLVNALVNVPVRPPALSASHLWTAGSTEASNASNTLADDICQSGGAPEQGTWSFALDKTTGVLTSVYADADLIAGQLTFSTPCTVDPPALVNE